MINKVKYVLRKDSLSSLYTSLIYPHLTYCVKSGAMLIKVILNPLYVRQKHLICLISNAGYTQLSAMKIKYTSFFPFHKLQYSHFFI